MSSSNLDYHQTTVRAFIAQLQPREWNRPVAVEEDLVLRAGDTLADWKLFNKRWDLHRFFDWPPDVFLLTSLLLHRTGAYRAGVTPPRGELWPDAEWPDTCRLRALEWRAWLCESSRLGRRAEGHPLSEYIRQIEICYKIPINDLHNVETVFVDRRELGLDAEVWKLCRCLMELHAIADETMRGVGTLFAPHVSLCSHEKHRPPDGIERIHLQANLLLTLRGTLSRIGKHRGIVLPKSRTPQSGVTLRSLSLHLSFHHTEVDVAWRAVPWTNIDENTLNLLLVPWPYRVSARAFTPEMGRETVQRLGRAGYFAYDPHSGDDGDGKPFDPAEVVRRVVAAQEEAQRVHFLVFPEAALDMNDLDRLKDELERLIHPSRMPLVIAGLTGREADGDAYNRVVLSIYYAQRWFDMVQDKHHRWKLDSDQIATYSLGGTLSGSRSWWESIRVPRRRLSFLTSNSWLTLAPLICEDLARLEPISDLIRGVGPTLLVALLLDGPQLTTRWPARYAGVLADDPGTSVLTLSSLGMCQRSVPSRPSREEAIAMRAQNGANVALWNDQFWRWHPIQITREDRAALLTVSTQWIQEDTFDMRAEAENSAVFTFQSIHVPKLRPAESGAKANGASGGTEAAEAQPSSGNEGGGQGESGPERMSSALADMNELSLYTFFVDALVDTPRGRERELRHWMYSVIGLLDVDAVLGPQGDGRCDYELLTLLRWSLWHRKGNPATMPTAHLFMALHVVSRLVARAGRRVEHPGGLPELDRGWGMQWQNLVQVAERQIEMCCRWMREDGAQADGPAGGGGRYSARLRTLGRRFERMAERAHQNVEQQEKSPPKSLPRLNRRSAGRIMFSAPLSILWAVHNRLSVRRRTRTLLLEDGKLLKRIENILESDLHVDFQRWKAGLGDRRPD